MDVIAKLNGREKKKWYRLEYRLIFNSNSMHWNESECITFSIVIFFRLINTCNRWKEKSVQVYNESTLSGHSYDVYNLKHERTDIQYYKGISIWPKFCVGHVEIWSKTKGEIALPFYIYPVSRKSSLVGKFRCLAIITKNAGWVYKEF